MVFRNLVAVVNIYIYIQVNIYNIFFSSSLQLSILPEHRLENPIGKDHIPKNPLFGAFAVSFREGRWRQMAFFCSAEAEWLDEWRFFTEETFRKSPAAGVHLSSITSNPTRGCSGNTWSKVQET